MVIPRMIEKQVNDWILDCHLFHTGYDIPVCPPVVQWLLRLWTLTLNTNAECCLPWIETIFWIPTLPVLIETLQEWDTTNKESVDIHSVIVKPRIWIFLPIFFLTHMRSHHITSHHITSHHITSHHITSHHITSHHITLHYITLHYITLHYITLHYITLHYITLHYITLHYITLHYAYYVVWSNTNWMVIRRWVDFNTRIIIRFTCAVYRRKKHKNVFPNQIHPSGHRVLKHTRVLNTGMHFCCNKYRVSFVTHLHIEENK